MLLMKCHGKTWMNRVKPIVTEPLELETLAAVLNEFADSGVTYRLYDPNLEGGRPKTILKRERPELLLLSGYITAVPEILRMAKRAKALNPETVVWVGGVHAEGNPQDFFSGDVDAVFFSNALGALRALLNHKLHEGLDFAGAYPGTPGIAWHKDGQWRQNEPSVTSAKEIPEPDRRYFEAHQKKTCYVLSGPVALLKTSLSCPHPCEFCYCRELNGGVYAERPMAAVMAELRHIDCETVWIVDDCFLTTRERAELWLVALEALALEGIRKEFIAYARADAIVRLADLIEQLKNVGFTEWIVGMEAVEDAQLARMGKSLQEEDNVRAAAVLAEAGVTLTALFLVTPDDSAAEFRRLKDWIRKHHIQRYTVSILTPLKGTALYESYKPRLTDLRFTSYDFLHLVMAPTQMPAWLFYLRFWRLSMGARLRR
jgi:radical SAM superfamily enzyme YgiQ (UPF0313 family)